MERSRTDTGLSGRLVLGRSLRSFHRRRIDIPVSSDSLVLDVGSGDKPHWRADVLVDRYPGAEHAGQRSGRPTAAVRRPLFDADAATLPFADGVFDYAICSHVLEHVLDPAAVVGELARVAKAGYIEVPEAASAKILDFPTHLWWCRRIGDTLHFEAKSARSFDEEIGAYIAASGVERRLAKLLDAEFDHRITSLHWEGHVDVVVEGRPDPALVAAAEAADSHHQVAQSIAGRALTAVLASAQRAKRRRAPIRLDDILRPDLRTGTGEVLTRRVYRLDAASAS
jgi:SAM-dependent methyltransferase